MRPSALAQFVDRQLPYDLRGGATVESRRARRFVVTAFAIVVSGPLVSIGLWVGGAPPYGASALLASFAAVVWTYESLGDTFRRRVANLADALIDARDAAELESEQLRWTLDNVAQGVLTVEPDGTLAIDRSAAIVGMFGEPELGQKLWEYFARVDPAFAVSLEGAWRALVDEKLPMDLVLYQLPRRISGRTRHYEVEYRPTIATDRLSNLLVVVSDVTDGVARERAQAREADTLGVFAQFVADRAGCAELFREVDGRVARFCADAALYDATTAPRELYALKASASTLGVASLSSVCHEIEARLRESGAPVRSSELGRIRETWADFASRLGPWLSPDASRDLQVNADDQELLRQAILANAPRTELLWLVDRWKHERTQPRLLRLAEHAKALSRRLGKGDVEVLVVDEGTRLDPACAGKFWAAFAHAVRNAVDHGLAPPAARDGRLPSIVLRAFEADGEVAIEVSDDGRGVDWTKVAVEARRRGLRAASRPELEAALMTEGFSTRGIADAQAGRGVGLAALRATCESLGGRVHIFSEPGGGTTVQCRLPGMGARPVVSIPPVTSQSTMRRLPLTPIQGGAGRAAG